MKNHKIDWRGGIVKAKEAAILNNNIYSQFKSNDSGTKGNKAKLLL